MSKSLSRLGPCARPLWGPHPRSPGSPRLGLPMVGPARAKKAFSQGSAARQGAAPVSISRGLQAALWAWPGRAWKEPTIGLEWEGRSVHAQEAV